jgi:hypothetical protein
MDCIFDTGDDMIEVLKQALTDAKRNERHNNVAETRYWLNQYKLIAEQAIAQHPPQRTWQGLTNDELTDLFYNTNLGQASAVAQAIALLKQKNGFAEEKNT